MTIVAWCAGRAIRSEVTGDRADFEALFDRFETLAVLSCAHPADVWFPRCRLHGACFAFWVRLEPDLVRPGGC